MQKVKEKELRKIFTELKSSNNKVSFEELYSKYNKLVYGIAFSILKNKDDSDDVVQIVFSKIYATNKEKLPTEKQASWLYSVAKNEAISYLRKKKNTIDIDSIYEIEEQNSEINKVIDRIEFNRLIAKLSEKEQEIISLKILSNLSFDEIAKLLDEPSGTVKWRYYKSINTLKLLLSNLGMFIVTFIIGLKTLVKENIKNGNNQVQEQEQVNTEQNVDNIQEDKENRVEEKEESKSESIKDSFTDEITNSTDDVIIDQETIVQPKTEFNYLGIGMISVSSIFLILTIIFSIILTKHQLKLRGKASK